MECSGGSAEAGKKVTAEWIADLAPACVVDVGAGGGAYQRMIADLLPSCRVVAVEVFWQNAMRLKPAYAEMIIADVTWLDWRRVVAEYDPDLVIFGDILEHCTRVDAIRLVHTVVEHGMSVLISIPLGEWKQGEVEGNPFERHLTTWTHQEIQAVFNPVRSAIDGPIGIYLVAP